ncbi:MAG: type II toxin-antitoxin system VapC family toxin [bacterium]|nr:type II toxin-antitoxin system VapC family toxin [bacterium]
MSGYYVDSSALVKRYVNEPGSVWTRQLTEPLLGNTILLAEISLAEVSAALAAKSRAPRGITQEQRDQALSLFLQDCDAHFTLLSIDRIVIDRAVELTQTYRLRGYDAVQLARALVASQSLIAENLPVPTFVTSDTDLLTAAETENLPIDNPLHHTEID